MVINHYFVKFGIQDVQGNFTDIPHENDTQLNILQQDLLTYSVLETWGITVLP